MKNMRLYRGRRRRNRFFLTLSVFAALFGLIWLGLILRRGGTAALRPTPA